MKQNALNPIGTEGEGQGGTSGCGAKQSPKSPHYPLIKEDYEFWKASYEGISAFHRVLLLNSAIPEGFSDVRLLTRVEQGFYSLALRNSVLEGFLQKGLS